MQRLERLTILYFVISGIIISLPFSSSMAFQSAGSVSGYVLEKNTGSALPGATVVIEKTDKADKGTAADLNGYYKLNNIKPGTYTIKARFMGYQSVTKYNIVVRSGGNPDINFELIAVAEELEGVTVTPDPFSKSPETPLSSQTLSQVEIASYPGGNSDIAKVVQSLPGVSSSVGGFRNDVIIRGGTPSENVYYLDGIEIPVINHFSTQGSAGGPVGLLNVSFFEEVSLDASAFHARYDDALSGVLQFDQRNGNAQQHQYNIRVSASEAAITAEGPLFKTESQTYSNTTFIASVRRSYLQFLFELIDLPFLPDYWDYQFKINHKTNGKNEFNIIGLGSVDDFSINVPNNLDAEQQAILDQVPIIKQWSSTTALSWKRRLSSGDGYFLTTLRTTGFNNSFTRFRDNVNERGVVQRTRSTEWNSTLRSEFNRFWNSWALSTGLMIENSQYHTNTLRISDQIDFSSSINYINYGFFGQLTRKWLDGRLTTSAGLRADGNSFTRNGHYFTRTLSPRGAFSYALDTQQKWLAKATIGRYFKLPPNTLLGFRGTAGNLVNQSANYIRTDHFVAGLSFNPRPSTQLSIEGFLKRYGSYPVSLDDHVSLANLGADFEIFGNETVQSTGDGRSYGMELTYQQKLKDNFYGIFAYTLYWSEFTSGQSSTFLPSLWDNRHLLTFTGGYKLGKNWELATRLRLLGGAPYADLKKQESEQTYPELIFDYSTLSSNRLDIFNVLDVRVDKKWNFDNWSFNLYLDIENVLGSTIPEPPTYGLRRNEAGAVIQPRTIVEIPDAQDSEVIPTLGIVADF